MNLDELTIGQAKELSAMFGCETQVATPWKVGENYFIRTVTMFYTGRLVEVTPQELVLEDAAWIADTGRFADSLESGNFSEVEPFPNGKVIIGRGAVIDAVTIGKLPRDQK